MIKATLSKEFKAKIKRTEKFKEMTKELGMGIMKFHALEIIRIFHDGIQSDAFNLKRLEPESVEAKKRQDFSLPEVPLYGNGDEAPKETSYSNMLRIRPAKGGYNIHASDGYHWSKRMKLSDLFTMHEMGKKIVLKNGTIINIPKRPALRMAYELYKKRVESPKKTFQRLEADYINNGKGLSEIKKYIKIYKQKGRHDE